MLCSFMKKFLGSTFPFKLRQSPEISLKVLLSPNPSFPVALRLLPQIYVHVVIVRSPQLARNERTDELIQPPHPLQMPLRHSLLCFQPRYVVLNVGQVPLPAMESSSISLIVPPNGSRISTTRSPMSSIRNFHIFSHPLAGIGSPTKSDLALNDLLNCWSLFSRVSTAFPEYANKFPHQNFPYYK
ncbi:hypothetical protein AXF42_Ash021512 [Apostasia shenzhenica]|uniref:Uncharacterized protein n=1 Tax=Apostasia shenzhenica TaxID=1088818 RepID=A0A2H9ZRT8_9ASPA|nr:hypothetical protein AXF42_Ash021512 [Apostasia shenzhenica]